MACIAVSVTMNAMAPGHGRRNLAIWVMPATIYALASDTLIGVVRARPWPICNKRAGARRR